jgi:hypothetical protein
MTGPILLSCPREVGLQVLLHAVMQGVFWSWPRELRSLRRPWIWIGRQWGTGDLRHLPSISGEARCENGCLQVHPVTSNQQGSPGQGCYPAPTGMRPFPTVVLSASRPRSPTPMTSKQDFSQLPGYRPGANEFGLFGRHGGRTVSLLPGWPAGCMRTLSLCTSKVSTPGGFSRFLLPWSD